MSWSQITTLLLLLLLVIVSAKKKEDDYEYSDEKDNNKNVKKAVAVEDSANKKKTNKPNDDDDYSDEKDTKKKESEEEARTKKKQPVSVEDDVDYCNLYDCGYRHIACNNNGKFDPKCSRKAKVDRLDDLKDKIVAMHNKQRNKIAAGLGSLPPAGRMASMQWHKELAKIAYFTVLKCTLDTDLCRSTKDFKYSGYNGIILGYSGDETLKISFKAVLKTAIGSWFNESEHVTPNIIKKYKDHSDENENIVGHFTLVANERNTHVGCAAIRYPEAGFQRVLVICNYATQNFKEEPVYREASVPASKCTTGRHHKYKNLCSTDEVYENQY